MTDKLNQTPFVKLALAIAGGCVLAYAIISAYRWAREQDYTPYVWLLVGVGALLYGAVWAVRRFGRQARAFLSGRRGLMVATITFFALLWYFAGVSLEYHRRAAAAAARSATVPSVSDQERRQIEITNPVLAKQLDDAHKSAASKPR